MPRNNRGVTLIALAAIVTVLFILSTIALQGGFSTMEDSRYMKGIAQLKVMQAEINTLYEEYKNADNETKSKIETYGEDISKKENRNDIESIYNEVKSTNINEENLGNFSDYRYYSEDFIKNTLDIDGIDKDFIINMKTRTVIALDGIERDKTLYYALCQIKGEQYNVDYKGEEITE